MFFSFCYTIIILMQKEMTMKKTSATVLLLSAVLVFMSCGFGSGDISTTGTKWNTTMTINGLAEKGGIYSDSKDSDGVVLGAGFNNVSQPYYKRVWEQLGNVEQVAEITSTITVDLVKSKLISTDGARNAVFGLAFDLDTNKAGGQNVDFCLVGIRQSGASAFDYYFERYTEVTPAKKASGITKEKSLGSYFTFSGGSGTEGKLYEYSSGIAYEHWTGSSTSTGGAADWKTLSSNYYAYTSGTSFSVDLYIKQATPGEYIVYLGKPNTTDKIQIGMFGVSTGTVAQNKIKQTTRIAGYTRYGPAKTIGGQAYLAGGIACYGSTPFDTKLVVNYKQDRTSLKGALFAEEE